MRELSLKQINSVVRNISAGVNLGVGDGKVDTGKALTEALDDRFRESCHKRGIHLSLQAPICVRGALRTKDWRPWQRGGERLSCRSEMRKWKD